MNDLLRRALAEARLTEAGAAARLGVDPKTVHRWIAAECRTRATGRRSPPSSGETRRNYGRSSPSPTSRRSLR